MKDTSASARRFRPEFAFPLVAALAALIAAPALAATPEPAPPGGAAPAPSAASADWNAIGDTEVPREIQLGIEDALKERVSKLGDEKNSEGIAYKRGSFSHHYHRVDDDTYTVTFLVNTASDRTMKTERFLFTMKRDGKNWKIAKEDLQDTYTDLHRIWFEDTTFARFDSLKFDREGLTVTGGKGSLYRVFRDGQLESLTVWAPDLAYKYTPPVPLEAKQWEKTKRDHADDVTFTPGYVRITCDPASCDDIVKTTFTGLSDAKLETVDKVVADRYRDVLGQNKKSREEDYLRGFLPRNDEDYRTYRIEVGKSFFENREPGTAIALDYDNWGYKEMTFSVYGMFESVQFWADLYSYYPESIRKANMDPTELERRDEGLSRYYDLQDISGTVEMGMGESELMSGDMAFRMTAKRDLTKLPFTMARLRPERPDAKESKSPRMTVNSVRDGDGNELTFIKFGATSGLVLFPKPIKKGTEFTLRMDFENRDVLEKLTPSYTYVSRGGWLPFARFGDLTMFDLIVRTPAQYTTLGIGEKVADEVKDGIRTTHWKSGQPVAFPTVIFGDYDSVESKVIAKKPDGTKIPVWIHVDKASKADWGITGNAMQARADEAANAINLYQAIYGVPYPYSKLDLVNDPAPALYGQSPSSLIYLGSPAFHDAMLASNNGGYVSMFMKSLVAHETAHQWWGSAVTNHNGGNYWFVESLAEWSAALFVENVHSKEEYQEHVNEWRKEILETDMQVSVQDASELWGGDDFGAYRSAVYAKGPYMFYIMRNIWGDEKMFKFLKTLCQELQGKEIVSRDIQRIAEQVFGGSPGSLNWFFDQWLRGVGLPEFKFAYTSRQTEDGKYLVEGSVEQKILYGKKKDELPGEFFTGVVPITVKGADGKEYGPFSIKIAGPKTPFRFKLGVSPKEVIFNKHNEMLSYDTVKSS